jgi:hypothetical protein
MSVDVAQAIGFFLDLEDDIKLFGRGDVKNSEVLSVDGVLVPAGTLQSLDDGELTMR